MAIKKFRFRPEGVNDYSDILHPETSADVVLLKDTAGNFASNNVEGALAELYSHRVPITRKINNKELSQDIILSASDVGAAPASHVGSGGSAHALATTSAAGFMSPEDKQILNSLNTTKVTGTVQYTDTVEAGSTITKYIPIGSGKTRGKMVVQPITTGMAGTGNRGVLIFFEISATRAVVVGGGGGGGGGEANSGASSRGLADHLTFGIWGTSVLTGIGIGATGSSRIGIKNVYISGSNIRIDFYNGYDSSDRLNCRIYWEVE